MSTETLRYAHVDLDDTERKEGRLISIGDVEYSLSDLQGNLVAATINVQIAEASGRPIGVRLVDPSAQFFARDEINVLCISSLGRKQGLLPRNVCRGLLQDGSYGSPLVASFTGTDFFFCDAGAFGPDKKFPTWTIPLYYINAPPDVYTKTLPVILGEVSDEGSVDPVTNLPNSRGLCPLTFVGLDGLATGAGGTAEVWGRFNVCLFAAYKIVGVYGSNLQGGLYGLATATSDGANPSTITLGGSPDLSTVLVGTTTITLFTLKGRVTSVIQTVTGETVTIHNQVATADATNVDWVIGEQPSMRVKLDVASRQGSDLMVPGYLGYVRPTTYEDIMGPDGEVYRVTDIWVRGPVLEDHLAGVVTLAANVIGVEDKGDGTGLPIIDYFRAYNWWLENCVLQNSKQPAIETYPTHLYPQTDGDLAQMGNTFADGVNKVKGSTFTAAQATSVDKIGGSGYQISAYFGGAGKPMRDVLQLWNDNAGCRLGINEWGQIFVWLFDDTADPTTWPTITHVSRVFGSVTRTNPSAEVENVVQGSYDWDPDQQQYRQPLVVISSADGILHNKNIRKLSKLIDGQLTRNTNQFFNVLQRRLTLTQNGPVYVVFTGDLGLLDYPVGSGIQFTSVMGPGALGYVNQPLIILKKRFQIEPHLVELTCLDVGGGSGAGILIASGQQFILVDVGTAPALSDSAAVAPVLAA